MLKGKLLGLCRYCAVWTLWDERFRAGCAVAELEEESPIINWSLELGTRLDSRLYALWNRTAGDCLLDSVLQATWGIYDKDSVLRKALHDSLHDCSHWWVRAAEPQSPHSSLGIVLLKVTLVPAGIFISCFKYEHWKLGRLGWRVVLSKWHFKHHNALYLSNMHWPQLLQLEFVSLQCKSCTCHALLLGGSCEDC